VANWGIAIAAATIATFSWPAKHSQARSIRAACGRDRPRLWTSVADNGIGFDPMTVPDGRGIVNLRDRLGAIGGELELTASRDGGVVVRGSVPLYGAIGG
jgi:signal transduction histidine kinase